MMPLVSPGCWTCRVRHRRCDLEAPMCKECTDRHVHCHGYGPKPAWMDGGSEEQKEKARIKAAIKENFRRVKKIQGRARRRASDLSRALSETPASARDELSATVITPRSPSYSSLPPHEAAEPEQILESEDTVNSHPQDEPVENNVEASPTPLESNANIDPQEAWLLMHYLDRVFPWQFPYFDSHSRLGNRGWLFSLLIKRGPLYHAALSLSSLLQSAMVGTEEEFQRKHRALDHHSRALGELCDMMSEKGDRLREDHAELAEFLTCSFMLISFEVFSGAEHDWLVHLDAATSVMNLLSAESIFNPTLHDHNNHPSPLIENLQLIKGGVKDGLEFLLVTVIWFDLFACLPTGRAPQLPYHRWLQIPGLNTADLMGCQNWVMADIGDIANFAIWKETQIKDGALSIRELANRGQEIERHLESGIRNLDLARSEHTEVEPMSNWVTRLFALAALVLLHSTVSGPLPALPEIQSAVARSMIALQNKPWTYSLTGSVWALCVIGCMAQSHARSFFENLMLGMVRESGRIGNIATVWKIIQKCWQLQEKGPADSRSTMREMGIWAILI